MSVGSLINTLGKTEVKVQRYSKIERVHGVARASVVKTFYIKARQTPVTGKEREILPEGSRTKVLLKIYVDENLRIDDDKLLQKADRLTIDGQEYEPIHSEYREGLGLKHYVVYVARVEQ